MRSRRASRVATASTAPAAPSRCPMADLVEETGIRLAALAQRKLDRERLGPVVQRSRGAVGVDVVDLLRGDAGVGEGSGHRRGLTLAIAAGGREVVGVGARAVAPDRPQYPRAARAGGIAALEHEHSRALAHHKAVAARVERAGDATVGEGVECAERRPCERCQPGLRSAGHDRVGFAGLEHAQRATQRMRAGCARGADREARASQPVSHRQGGGASIAHHQRHSQRRDALRTPLAQSVLTVDERRYATDPRAQHAAHTSRVVGQLILPARVGERLRARRDRQLCEPVGPASLLDREEVSRVEVRAWGLAVADAAHSGAPALVQGARADAKRRDGTHPGDDDRLHLVRHEPRSA